MTSRTFNLKNPKIEKHTLYVVYYRCNFGRWHESCRTESKKVADRESLRLAWNRQTKVATKQVGRIVDF